jgi:hypothetical protein
MSNEECYEMEFMECGLLGWIGEHHESVGFDENWHMLALCKDIYWRSMLGGVSIFLLGFSKSELASQGPFFFLLLTMGV